MNHPKATDSEHEPSSEHAAAAHAKSPTWVAGMVDRCTLGFTFYYMTSLIVIVAAVFAMDFVPLCRAHSGSQTRVDLVSSFATWDGEWYVRIASAGYSYDLERMSSVAFFPLYPWLAGALVHTTGMRPEWALLLVSHGALIAVFALSAAYVHRRFPKTGEDLTPWTLLALGLFPTTFYFRMAYTESIFLLVTVIALYGMERGWRPLVIALVIGLATAARTVGVALVPVFALYLWQRMAGAQLASSGAPIEETGGPSITKSGTGTDRPDRSQSHFSWLWQCAVWLPVCCWGLLGYMAFQWVAFGEPLAFVKTQVHWNERSLKFADQMIGAFTLEPIRAVYDPSSPCYWGRVPPQDNLLFNLKAANPVYFLAAVALVGVGAWKRWLNARELLLSAGLLLIPYCLQASRAGMSSHARYAAVVFPMYLVLGHLLHRTPPPLAAALLAVSGLFLAIYSAMFVSWYWYY